VAPLDTPPRLTDRAQRTSATFTCIDAGGELRKRRFTPAVRGGARGDVTVEAIRQIH